MLRGVEPKAMVERLILTASAARETSVPRTRQRGSLREVRYSRRVETPLSAGVRPIAAAECLTDNQLMVDRPDLFPVEALAENRSGHLTSAQAGRFHRMVSGRRKSTWGLAVPVGAIGALLLLLSGPAATAVTRHLTGWGFVAAVGVILVAPAFDPLAADVREGRVETIQGAVGKRRRQSSSRTGFTRYYLVVAGRRLRTYLSAYDAAPDAGYVRAYYLPRTRRLVNLERLPNPETPSGPDEVRDMFSRMAHAFVNRDATALAEARASAAGLIDAARDAVVEPSNARSEYPAGGLTREVLLGTWTHPLATVILANDGTATVRTIMGATQKGHWSVDAHGRLVTDATGTMKPTDAALEGGRLTIQIEGRRLTFTRAVGA